MNKPFTFLQKMRSAVGKFLFFLLLPLKFIRSNNVAMERAFYKSRVESLLTRGTFVERFRAKRRFLKNSEGINNLNL